MAASSPQGGPELADKLEETGYDSYIAAARTHA